MSYNAADRRALALERPRFHALWCHRILRAPANDAELNRCVEIEQARKLPTVDPSKADFRITRVGHSVASLFFTGEL